jgi:hypothetical protein
MKLLWLAFFTPVSMYTFKWIIKNELETWGSIDSVDILASLLVAFIIGVLGPIAVIAFIIYNVIEGIAQSINEGYKK